jgi:hypothetical protein
MGICEALNAQSRMISVENIHPQSYAGHGREEQTSASKNL